MKASKHMIFYLPVELKTGKVDYEVLTYMLEEIPESGHRLDLIDGWEWRKFKLSQLTNTNNQEKVKK